MFIFRSCKSALLPAWFLLSCIAALQAAAEDKVPTVAVLTTVWHQNSHADVIAGRLFDGYSLDGQGEFPKLKLVSLYVDQFEPRPDKSRAYSQKHGVPIYGSIRDALTLGGDKLAVDGILMICEHGDYPESEFGSIQHPKRKFFEEIVKVFEASGRVVPVFNDKHLEDDWTDIRAIYEMKQRLQVPMMAGSSLPGLWRYPAVDTQRDKPLKEIVATSYHRLDTYGFHALEMAQCLAERRKNGETSGETGVKRVRTISGPAVWAAGEAGEFDLKLLDEVCTRFKDRPLAAGKTVRDVVKEPILFMIDYNDGLRTSILTMDGANVAFAAGWRYADGTTQSCDFWTQEARPFQHFAFLLKGVEQMIHTGQPTWPVERTLMTSGQLDALLVSHKKQGEWIETPHLATIKYQSDWNWQMPPPPPPDRPLDGM